MAPGVPGMCYVLPSLHHHLLTRHRVQVGPLPISNESTYTSLDWATTKGKAVIRNYNADEDLQTEFFVRMSPSSPEHAC